jgi:hypothetical protein
MFPYLISDVSPGVLYCNEMYPSYLLWISYNYGENWEFVDNPGTTGRYTSGCTPGEIYKNCTDYQGTLYRSIDYGENFEVVNDSAKYILEVGVQAGELYGIDGSYAEDRFTIHYSSDYGYSFPIEIDIDSTIAGEQIAGFYPTLSRGTIPGEVYLTTWHLPCNYYIYRSTDYGQTFELQYQSEYINIYSWWVYYTAGREPGSFYIMMHSYDDLGIGTYLRIFYSNDYAETFTEYFHHLTEDYFVSVDDQPINQPSQEITLNNFPNPFNPETTISYDLPVNIENPVIEIFNIKGEKIRQYSIVNPSNAGQVFQSSIVWDGADQHNKQVSSGVYLYRIKSNEGVLISNKMLLLR